MQLSSRLFTVYLLKQLLLTLCALAGGSIALILLTQSLHFITMIVQHGLSLGAFLHLTFLMTPTLAATILPISTFLVILFIYQKLTHDHELVIMSSAGLSPFEQARPGIFCALISCLSCYLLTLWLAPLSYHAFHRYEYEIKNRVAAFLIEEGVFTKISPSLTLYVQHHDSENNFYNLMIEDTHNPLHHLTIFAEKGNILPQNNAIALFLSQGVRQDYNPKTKALTSLYFSQDSFTLAHQDKNDLLGEDPSEVSLFELFSPPPNISQKLRHKYLVEGWNRLTMPLSCISYGFIALITILKAGFSRHGHFLRPLCAILLTLSLLLLSFSLKSLAERHTLLLPALALEVILPILICGIFFYSPSPIPLHAQIHEKKK